MNDIIREAVADQMRREAVARDEVLRTALLTGTCGVLETRRPGSTTFEVSPDVPFGHIYVDDGIDHRDVGD